MTRNWTVRLVLLALALAALVTAAILGHGFWLAGRTIFDLLTENRRLKQAVANLKEESQIGMARVLAQTERDGRLYTRLLFVETARDDPKTEILRRECELEGSDIHFDALIVKFSPSYVGDGKARALFLWRGIYSEKIPPERAFLIETPGTEFKRYADLFSTLRVRDRKLFWKEIWSLSEQGDRLGKAGVQAVYGAALHKPLKPGFLYLIKIGGNGQFYLETLPAI